MTRLRADQACLDAQVRSQVAQQLTAELAVPCPDCGVEAWRSCRDSFDRAVRPHLARAVAANRRDTERCPPPDQTPTAPDCAPAIAPEAVSFHGPGRIVSERTDELGRVHREVERPKRPTCACGQTIWAGSLDGPSPSMCADCEQELNRNRPHVLTLDERIEAAKPETKSDDATECAWSTPTSDGEGWT